MSVVEEFEDDAPPPLDYDSFDSEACDALTALLHDKPRLKKVLKAPKSPKASKAPKAKAKKVFRIRADKSIFDVESIKGHVVERGTLKVRIAWSRYPDGDTWEDALANLSSEPVRAYFMKTKARQNVLLDRVTAFAKAK